MFASHHRRAIVERQIIYQSARATDPGHDLVAGVDAKGAGDALHLLALADIYAHGADGDAGIAVDTVA